MLIIALKLLHTVRLKDRKNFRMARAPRLPISYVSEADYAWVKGQVKSDSPLTVPHFHFPCVYYAYRKERGREVKNKGHPGIEWRIVNTGAYSTDFDLIDGDDSITVGGEAEFISVAYSGYDYEDRLLRHSCLYLPVDVQASVLGLVGEQGKTMGAGKAYPLLVTRLTPDEFAEAQEGEEKFLRIAGFFVFYIAVVAGLIAAFTAAGYLPAPVDSEEFVNLLPAPAVLAILPLLSFWSVSLYNTIVEYQIRTENSWHAIEIEMKNRNNVIPALQEVIKHAKNHEAYVYRRIAELRSELMAASSSTKNSNPMESEAVIHEKVCQLLALKEQYPELKTDELFMDFGKRLSAHEEKIAHARTAYNAAASEFNALTGKLPHLIIAAVTGRRPYRLFMPD